MSLADKLVQAADGMTQAERACFKIMLAAAAAELMPSGRLRELTSGGEALRTLISAASRLQPHRSHVPPGGYVYRGRPDWVSDDLLQRLQHESETLRPTAIRFHEHLVVSGAPIAHEVATSRPLAELLERRVGPVVPTTKANYLYYDEPGMGIEPHLDTEEFSLNVIMMLQHASVANPSALVLFPADAPPQRIHLRPGEVIAIFADSVIHAREYMGDGERVTIAAFGFAPPGDPND